MNVLSEYDAQITINLNFYVLSLLSNKFDVNYESTEAKQGKTFVRKRDINVNQRLFVYDSNYIEFFMSVVRNLMFFRWFFVKERATL